jgi:DNA-binding transcriptional ArsR family regulator
LAHLAHAGIRVLKQIRCWHHSTASRTTTEIFPQLGLAPAAVSAHLSRLKVASLVEPHRSGRKVYYRLSFAGESLLEVFGETG